MTTRQRRRRYVVTVVDSDTGAARCYGPWYAWERAAKFADTLVERDLDAQVTDLSEPLIRDVLEVFE